MHIRRNHITQLFGYEMNTHHYYRAVLLYFNYKEINISIL